MASVQLRHRGFSRGSTDQTISMDAVLATSSSDLIDTTVTCGPPTRSPAPASPPSGAATDDSQEELQNDFVPRPWRSSAPPQPSKKETHEHRSARSSSTVCRNTNRLSLTLPILPPNSVPTRPTPTSIPSTSSVPHTPSDSIGSGMASPNDPGDFIIAIAAQERRVLELREELGRAEDELKRLKTQWKSSEMYRVNGSVKNSELLRAVAPAADSRDSKETLAARRNIDDEKKKALLLGQSTPREHRRRVMRGGHTRTLSLLSPTRTDADDSKQEQQRALRSPDPVSSRPTSELNPVTPAALNKRATWAPRQAPQEPGYKQLAQDFKAGLWTFVEDLRQATVGDEAISATSTRTGDFAQRVNGTHADQETIRASTMNRGRIPSFQPDTDSKNSTPSRAPSGSFQDRAHHRRTASKPEPRARKHFSWTPLTFDDVGDDDWSNWDTPNGKSSRWSGTTLNGDIIPAIPEKVTDDNESTLCKAHVRQRFSLEELETSNTSVSRRKQSRSELRSSSPPTTLGELPSAILNTLTPRNLKRMSAGFMKEWERSLSSPTTTPSHSSFQARIKDKAP